MAFSDIDQWQTYIDTYIIANGNNDITGPENNEALNGAVQFVRESPLNWSKTDIHGSGGVFVLSKAMTVFITNTPTSISWVDNWYFEYYIVNATTSPIPLTSGTVYYNALLVPLTAIPANTVVHIAKSDNDLWIQVNNAGGTGTSLPAQTGHDGETLITTGSVPFWGDTHISLTADNFESDGVTYVNSTLQYFTFSIFWNEINRFIYQSEGEFTRNPSGGFEITIDGFDANTNDCHIELFLKGKYAPGSGNVYSPIYSLIYG